MTPHSTLVDRLRAFSELSAYANAGWDLPDHATAVLSKLCREAADALATPQAPAPAAAEPTITEEMVTAYLQANDAYWKEGDSLPTKPGKWRNGTPREATRVSLKAALAASQPSPQEPAQAEELLSDERVDQFLDAYQNDRRIVGDYAAFQGIARDIADYVAARKEQKGGGNG
jgi:hypothetical protein